MPLENESLVSYRATASDTAWEDEGFVYYIQQHFQVERLQLIVIRNAETYIFRLDSQTILK